jgi:hypothetical protein
MTAHTASLLNALVLIALSSWAYLSSSFETPSWTVLIPTYIGIVLLACYPGIRSGNRIVTWLAALITLLTLFALFRPLMSVLVRDDTPGLIRVSIMMATTAMALIFFVKGFIDALKSGA